MATITWNPSDKSTNVTLSNNNLTITSNNDKDLVRATQGYSSGKWYWEIILNDAINIAMIGISNINAVVNVLSYTSANARYVYTTNGSLYGGSCYANSYSSKMDANDVIGVALDIDNGTLGFYRNGVFLGTAFSDIKAMGTVYPTLSNGSTTITYSATANFGATPFRYPVPIGYKPLENTTEYLSLIKQDNKYYNINYNYQELGIPSDENQLSRWYSIYGLNDIDIITKALTFKKVQLIKDDSTEIWSAELDANDISGNIQQLEVNDSFETIQYDCITPYRILDKLNNEFQIETRLHRL